MTYFGVAPIQGTSISATAGTWSGSPPITFAYRWEQCDAGGNNCSLAGGTASTYVPTAADVGHTLRVRVTATNVAGSTSAESEPTRVVRGLLPSPVLPPTVTSDKPLVGQTVVGRGGSWSGQLPITYRYTFEKCTANGSTCVPIPTPAPRGSHHLHALGRDPGRDRPRRLAARVPRLGDQNSLGEENARSELTEPSR